MENNQSSVQAESENIKPFKEQILPYWNKVKAFVKRDALILTLLLVLVLQFVPNGGGSYPWGGLWMRLEGQKLHFAGAIAEQNVDNYIQQQALQIVNAEYPNLPDSKKKVVLADVMKKVRSEFGDQLETEKSRLADQIRAHFSYVANGKQYVYMPDIDTYFYLRYARNVLEKGHHYDELRGGIPWDNHMTAPLGTSADRTWHPYLIAFMFKVHSFFDDTTTLMQTATYFPILMIFLSLIFAFLIAWHIAGGGNSGLIAGFFAATMLALSPPVFGRTVWGHMDTDVYNVFFPVLIFYLLVESAHAKTPRKQYVFAALTGAGISVYSMFWSGWWYVFDFILGAIGIAIVYEVFRNRKSGLKHIWEKSSASQYLKILGVLFAVALVLSFFTSGFVPFLKAGFTNAISFTKIKQASLPTLWPNVLTTVAELKPTDLFGTGKTGVIPSVGGKLIFLVSLLGIVLLALNHKKSARSILYSSLLTLWFIGTIYASLKGVRFILLLGPALSVAFGVSAGLIYTFAERFLRSMQAPKWSAFVVTVLIFAVIIAPPKALGIQNIVKTDFATIPNNVPIVNDAWWNVLTKIKEDSKPDAIINSWWDFGHHFKYIADRAVTFDGASQSGPQAHWIGKVLQTDNEDEAVAILRMLNCGGTLSYDAALNATQDPLLSVKFLKEIILLNESEAKKKAMELGVPENITTYTHCKSPEDYFIVSGDMVGKAAVWSHFGLWDFEKAEVWLKWRNEKRDVAVQKMVERFGISKEEAESLYDEANSITSEDQANAWISPWLSFVNLPSSCRESDGALECGRITINGTSSAPRVLLNGRVAPAGELVLYDNEGNVKVFDFNNSNSNLVVSLWPSGSGTLAMFSEKPLARSMFARLFFMDGLGLKHFKPLVQDSQLVGGKIIAYKVDWDGQEPYIPESLKPKESVVSGAKVKLNYIGWTDEGVFDSTIVDWKSKNVTSESSFEDYNTRPFEFVFGKQQLIAGFSQGIENMTEGESKILRIPPEMAYGTDPSAHPLGNKTLNFKIRVESIS
ncbi:hypothetical protein D6825_02045 [Candidatus Woesearchaeota archaeon]|nr:MAG: hypothetical protein D6825_02045 [Candidatus Woesearchaeota archaeon]